MSAAATAAGYLYASGRLRGRGAREDAEPEKSPETPREAPKRLRVAVYQPEPAAPAAKPKRVPRIEYRKRRVVSHG
jgi:hypothetical protein